MRRTLLVLGVVLAMAALAVTANTGLRVSGWTLADEAPVARTTRLAENWRVVRPEGEGPAPVAILLSGCDGPHDNMGLWAEALAQAGWASVVLDSHAPRGLSRWERWRLVCTGQLLTGAERAGDVAATVATLRRMEGWTHPACCCWAPRMAAGQWPS